MLNPIRWAGLTLLSTLFLSVGYASASPDLIKQATPPTNVESSAPKPISQEKQSLIRQLLEMTGGRQQYEQTQQILMMHMQQQMQPMIEQTVNSNTSLSPAEREVLTTRLTNNIDSIITQFSEALSTEVTYDELLERVYYPVYDQYFTEADLRDLIAFYETPIGEKLLTVTPELLQTSLQLSSQVYMPVVTEVLDRVIRQQIEGSKS